MLPGSGCSLLYHVAGGVSFQLAESGTGKLEAYPTLPPETYLAEAQQIAERGPMPLYLADVWLHRGRMRGGRVRGGGEECLAQARELIQRH